MFKKTMLTSVLCYMLLGVIVSGLTIHPGVHFYGGYLDVTFQDTTVFSYLAVGDQFAVFDALNLSISNINSVMEINISHINSSVNLTSGTTVLRFNATYTGASAVFNMRGNQTNSRYNVFVDNTAYTHIDSANNVRFTINSWSTHDIEITLEGYVPECPSNGDSVYNGTTHSVNFTWNNNNDSDATVVVRNNNSYPSSVTDGYVVQNGTDTFYNVSVDFDETYFTVWGYNVTTHTYSSNSCKLDLGWGAIAAQVYNESKPWQPVDPFGILISNEGGTQTYQNNSANNILYLSKDDIPFGDNTIILINGTGYESRTYYYDFELNHFYNLTFYLPPFETEVDPGGGDDGGSGENYSTTRPYTFRVVDQDTYPVADATVDVRRYFNTTESWNSVSILLTNGYGECSDDFIPGVQYKIFVSKTGYDDDISDWEPDPLFYGSNYPVILQINSADVNVSDLGFWDVITFNGSLYDNNTLNVIVSDISNEIIDVQIYVYEVYNYSETLYGTGMGTNQYNSWWFSGVNISREYHIVLFMNHTSLGFLNQSILVEPLRDPLLDADKIEDTIEDVAGGFELGYVATFFIYSPLIACLVLPGRKHPGFAIVIASLYAGAVTAFLLTNLLMFAPFICAIGIALIAVKKGVISL